MIHTPQPDRRGASQWIREEILSLSRRAGPIMCQGHDLCCGWRGRRPPLTTGEIPGALPTYGQGLYIVMLLPTMYS